MENKNFLQLDDKYRKLIQEIKKLENKIKDIIKQSNIVVRVKNNEIA